MHSRPFIGPGVLRHIFFQKLLVITDVAHGHQRTLGGNDQLAAGIARLNAAYPSIRHDKLPGLGFRQKLDGGTANLFYELRHQVMPSVISELGLNIDPIGTRLRRKFKAFLGIAPFAKPVKKPRQRPKVVGNQL